MAANSFDDRIVRVSIQIGEKLNVYDQLYITASGTKFANPNQNEAEVKIANLSKEVRDYLVTETSPFNKNNTPKKLIIEAGRISTGYSRVFIGDIVSACPSQPPDIIMTIKAKTGQFNKGKLVSKTAKSKTSLKEIAQSAADDLGVSLQFEANDKQIANHSYCGAATKQIDDIQETGDVDVYVDDDKLIVKNMNVPLTGVVRILNAETGMIGIPEVDENGLKVKMLFDNKTTLGGALQIESKINPALNGNYAIYKLAFDLANRDTPFYWIASVKRLNR